MRRRRPYETFLPLGVGQDIAAEVPKDTILFYQVSSPLCNSFDRVAWTY
jgi:hypothetical protein